MELLSPAGDFESLITAVKNGADAVYIGGPSFSARKNAKNFTEEEIKKAVDFCHLRGVHVTALCPGFVHTEFHQRMDMDKTVYPGWMWLDAERVVREGLADAFAGKGISIPSKRYKVLAWFGARGPQALVARIAGRGR